MTLRYQPWNNWLLEVAWVANHGSRLYLNARPLNDIRPEVRDLGSQIAQSVPNPFLGIITGGTLSAATITREQLLRPYPHFLGVNSGYSFLGNNIYHALAVKVEKRFSRGFSALVSYTKAKQIDDASAGTVRPGANSSIGIQNWYNLRAERSKSANDIPQRLVLTGLWEVPLGRSGSALVRNTLGGWQLNVITTIENGPPLSISATAAGGANRPNIVPGIEVKLDTPTLERCFILRPFHSLSHIHSGTPRGHCLTSRQTESSIRTCRSSRISRSRRDTGCSSGRSSSISRTHQRLPRLAPLSTAPRSE